VYNEWRERRRITLCSPARREGKGRIVYIPRIIPAAASGRGARTPIIDPEPGATLRPTARMSPPVGIAAKPPGDYQTIADNLPNGLSIQTEAAAYTVMELLTSARDAGETIAHLSISTASTNRCPSG